MKPILFNTEMVRAILEGRKTVTRRALKQPFEIHPNGYITKQRGNERLCPYEPPYEVNDILYVRETWQSWSCEECDGYDCEPDNNFYGVYCSEPKYLYKATDEETYKGWKPSIHMPKEAARIFLRVTNVRVERLQDITNEQILLEGVHKERIESILRQFPEPVDEWERTAYTLKWANLWDSTIKKDQLHKYGWNINPYVWVIEFERLECGSMAEMLEQVGV